MPFAHLPFGRFGVLASVWFFPGFHPGLFTFNPVGVVKMMTTFANLPFTRLVIFAFLFLHICIFAYLLPGVSLPMAIGIIHIQPSWGCKNDDHICQFAVYSFSNFCIFIFAHLHICIFTSRGFTPDGYRDYSYITQLGL